MSRKRSISSDMSTDARIEELAECGTLPCLLYTWAIPHADDWGRITGDPRQFRLLVCPALRVTAAQVDEALSQIEAVGLWLRYEVDGSKYIAFPQNPWWKHQSYIDHEKRENDKSRLPAPPTTERPRTQQNTTNLRIVAASEPTPSPSPSPTPSLSPMEDVGLVARALEIDQPTDRQIKRIAGGLAKYSHLDGEMVADSYVPWEEKLPPKKRHKDRVSGWLNQMEMRSDQPTYFKRGTKLQVVKKDGIDADMQARFQAKSDANLAKLRAQRIGGPSAAAQ